MKNTVMLLFTFVLVSIMFSFGSNAIAQTAAPNSTFPPNLKKYFTDKYPQMKDIMSSLVPTPYGPQGKLHLSGSLMPKNMPSVGGSREDRSLAIARAFLHEEAPLLGITNMDEVKEVGIPQTQKFPAGYSTAIYFKRYINNLELDRWEIHIEIGSDETIDYVQASVVPASPELYQSVTKTPLPEDKIKEIVFQDMKSSKSPFSGYSYDRKSEFKKVATYKSPYVIWKVHASPWQYTLDAFTGEILTKKSTIIED